MAFNPGFRGPNPKITERAILAPVNQPLEAPNGATANPNVPVQTMVPVQGVNLRPVDIGDRKPWAAILATFARAAGREDTLSVRAPGKDGDLNPTLGVGYFNAQGQALRGTAAQSSYGQGKRSQMPALPTPQALLRQVSGIGDPVTGR